MTESLYERIRMAFIFKRKRENKKPGESDNLYEAMYEFNGDEKGDLCFKAGDELVITRQEGDWWKAKNKTTGKTGRVPSNFVQKKLETEEIHKPFVTKSISENDVATPTSSTPVVKKPVTPSRPKAVAVYDYESVNEGDISFTRGDKMKILDKSDAEWWLVVLVDSEVASQMQGYIPSSYVKELEDITSERWYAGKISRNEASAMLSEPQNSAGSFLVRDSETSEGYALSVRKDNDDIRHYRILMDDFMNYKVVGNQTFATIRELVEHYKHWDETPGLLHQPCKMRQAAPPPQTTTTRTRDNAATVQQTWEIDRSTIVMGKKLGSGQFGDVMLGRWQYHTEVAVKSMRTDTMEVEEFRREAETMQRLRHPRLIQLYGICTTPEDEPVLIVTELMKGGSLLDHLRTRKKMKKLHTSQELATMGSQVASGMAYLEAEEIVHRDLAARNVLVDEAGKNVKIADFGLARVLQEDVYQRQHNIKMPVKWTAPEAVEDGLYTNKSDVWSYGIFLFELFEHGTQPYATMNNSEALEFVKKGNRMKQPNKCPKDIYEVMKKCWNADYMIRPSFAELKVQMEKIQKKL